jgi:hypothetical protein
MVRPMIWPAVAILAFSALLPAAAQDFERGTIIPSIVCRSDPAQSYALYLPTAFNRSRVWPALILFDPGARGPLAIRAFLEAAEKYGWMLAASNTSRNGPIEDSLRAGRALWADLVERLPVDGRRVYAAGFSGGARVASVMPSAIGRRVAAVIGCGAGLAIGLDPGGLKADAYFGLAGLGDFNYDEMKVLDRTLDAAGLPHRFFYFEGPHDWPPPAAVDRTLGWLEVEAMKRGARPADLDLAAAVVNLELDDAASLETDGRAFWAVERLAAARSIASGLDLRLPGLAGLDGRIAALSAGREFKAFLDAEKARDRRDDEFQAVFPRVFGLVEDPETGGPTAVPRVLREMEIGFLAKEARTARTVEERALASRLLFEFSFAAQARARDLYRKRDFGRAATYFDLALAACEPGLPREKYLLFDRACVAARAGDRKAALKFLTLAVDKGFADREFLEQETDLDPIRDTPAFRAIQDRVRAAAAETDKK